MQSNTAIKIEGLGKRYLIPQNADPRAQGNYVALRDVLAQQGKKIAAGFKDPSQWFSKIQKDEFWALNDINMDIKIGDKVALIGHNGAGKSTLLKILSRITEPTKGRVDIRGHVTSLLEVGTGFHPELTGRENIYLNGSILGMDHADINKVFDEIVDFAGVERFLNTPVKRYSSGMRMRLGFAVAAHLNSDILIIDEVLAVGDAAFQEKCMGKMDQVSKSEGKTIIFVSHNMGAVQQLCDTAYLLEKGQVVLNGSVEKVVESYLHHQNDGYIVHHSHPDIDFKGLDGFSAKGNQISFSVLFESKVRMPECYLHFSLRRNDGLEIFTYRDNQKRPTGSVMKVGMNKLEITIDNVSLNSGLYNIGICLDNNEGTPVFCADMVKLPEILAHISGVDDMSLLACECKIQDVLA